MGRLFILDGCKTGVLVGAGAGCVVTCPFLWERDAVDGDVGRTAGLVVGVSSKIQDLEG